MPTMGDYAPQTHMRYDMSDNNSKQTISTGIGALEARVGFSNHTGDVCVRVNTPFDIDAEGGCKPVHVRKIPYNVGLAFNREGEMLSCRVNRLDGKAVSDSARKVIQGAAQGVFGAYIENAGREVYDQALLARLEAEKSEVVAQMELLSDKVVDLDAKIAEVEDRLTA